MSLLKKKGLKKLYSRKKAAKKQLKKVKNYSEKKTKIREIFFLQDEISITLGPWLMKLYTTPPSILSLVTWVPRTHVSVGPLSQGVALIIKSWYTNFSANIICITVEIICITVEIFTKPLLLWDYWTVVPN